MEKNYLKQLILKYQLGDYDVYIDIKSYFNNIIKSFCKKSYYDDLENEIDLKLLYVLNNINLNDFPCDMSILKYINTIIKNEYINKNKKTCEYQNRIVLGDDYYFDYVDSNANLDFNLIINDLEDDLKKILILKYKYGLKQSEIAKIMNRSKQMICYLHSKSLKILKNNFKKDGENIGK